MKTLIAAVLIIFSLNAKAGDGVLTGKQLLDWCDSKNTTYSSVCYVYLGGFQAGWNRELSTWANTSETCNAIDFPDNVTFSQLGLVYVNWAKNHPEKLHESIAANVLRAFTSAWPCGKKTQS